jgi:hypothetical protein
LKEGPSEIDSAVGRAIGLRRTIRIREEHAIWDERPEFNLLPAHSGNGRQHGDHQKDRSDDAAPVLMPVCCCLAKDISQPIDKPASQNDKSISFVALGHSIPPDFS